MTHIRLAAVLALIAGGILLPQAATAAQSYDSCNNFIDSLPTTISTQGVWCLRKDLSTANTSGNVITINANNVTIDCNDFKIGGLAAGNGSEAIGIGAENRQNATIRNCNIRGFHYGVRLTDGAGHLVEHNRIDNSLKVGISISGDNNTIRRNRVYDTGGATGNTTVWGISGKANIVDNTISGLFADQSGGRLFGISSQESGGVVQGNKVSGLDMNARQGGIVYEVNGLYLNGLHTRASDNQIVANGVDGWGIKNDNFGYCLDNTVSGFSTNIDNDCISSGNLTLP